MRMWRGWWQGQSTMICQFGSLTLTTQQPADAASACSSTMPTPHSGTAAPSCPPTGAGLATPDGVTAVLGEADASF